MNIFPKYKSSVKVEIFTSVNSGEFVLALYERTGVAAVPGIHFGEKFSRYVRFNGARPINEINEAVGLITRFINDSR